MEWINKYQVEKDVENNTKVITGDFTASAGNFTMIYKEDQGDSSTLEVSLSNGQFGNLNFTITGTWEIQKVVEMFKLIGRV